MKKRTDRDIPHHSEIAPAAGGQAPNKFSRNLHRFVQRTAPRRGCGLCIYDVTYPKKRRSVFAGTTYRYIGDFHGRALTGTMLRSVLSGRSPLGIAVRFIEPGVKIKDVTKAFWRDYLRLGVCSIHNSGHIWDEKKAVRTCQTCGKRQVPRSGGLRNDR